MQQHLQDTYLQILKIYLNKNYNRYFIVFDTNSWEYGIFRIHFPTNKKILTFAAEKYSMIQKIIIFSLLLLPLDMALHAQSFDMPTQEERARLDSMLIHRLQLCGFYNPNSNYETHYIYGYGIKDESISADTLTKSNILKHLKKTYLLNSQTYPDSPPPIVYYREEYKLYRDSLDACGCRGFDSTSSATYNRFRAILDSCCDAEGIYNPSAFNNVRAQNFKTNIPRIHDFVIEDVDKHILYTWKQFGIHGAWLSPVQKNDSFYEHLISFLDKKKYAIVLFVEPACGGFYIALTHNKQVMFYSDNYRKTFERIDIEQYVKSLWFLKPKLK